MGSAKRKLGAAHGGSVRMFSVAATDGKIERQVPRRLSSWTRDYLRAVALADLACAVIGVFIAAQVRFGSNVTATYLGLSLALPILWIAALWLAGAYDVRFIGTGSDEYRRILSAGVSLTAAVAIFSYAVNLELSRAYVVIALPGITLFDLVARFAMRKRLHRQRMQGKCLHSVVAVGHELAVADLDGASRRCAPGSFRSVKVTICTRKPPHLPPRPLYGVFGGTGTEWERGQLPCMLGPDH